MYREEVPSTLVSFSCGASIELEFIDVVFFLEERKPEYTEENLRTKLKPTTIQLTQGSIKT